MKNKWAFLISIMAMLNFALLSVPAIANPMPVWQSSLDDDVSITVDGGAIVSGPSSYVPGAIDNAFAGNGSVYAAWDNTDVENIFDGVWNDSNGFTVDLYFRGDHWSTHSGDSGLWGVIKRYGGNDAFILAQVRDGDLRLLFADVSSPTSQYKYLLTGITLADDTTYRLTMRQYDGDFEAYLDGGAYTNDSPIFTAGDLPAGYTCPFPPSYAGPPGGREMTVANRSQFFGGILQSGEWVDNVRVFNGYYTPAEIGASSEPPPVDNDGDINDDSAVDFKDVKIMANHWLLPDCNAAEGNLDETGLVDFNDYCILAEDWLDGAAVSITAQPENAIEYPGDTADFTIYADGSTPITYQWQKDGNDLTDGGRISGTTTNMLEISNANEPDEGTYRCIVENYYSTEISDGATLIVTPGVAVGRQTLYESNTSRRYILYVPVNYSPQKLYPLVISSHGTSQDGDTEMDSTGPNNDYDNGTPTWPTLAEDRDVIVACPDMTGAYGSPPWSSGQLIQLASDDEAIMYIIAEIEAIYNIDTGRILITGFSGGGHIPHYVGLRHPDVFSASSPRHGNFHEDETPSPLPDGATDMLVYIFTGTNDSVPGTDEAITWYTAQGFNYIDSDHFSTPPSDVHTTDRHHALNWFLNLGLKISSDGHWIEFRGKKSLLIGDSATHGWPSLGTNFDQEAYIDALASRNINMLMIWSYIATSAATQIADFRIGYDAPEIWPWEESGGIFDLTDFNDAYFNRLEDLVEYANNNDIVVLITIHDGWPKTRFSDHPFNTSHGGPLTSNTQYVELSDYNNEMPETYNPGWNRQQKNQYFQERFTARLIDAVGSYPNVIFEIFNEGEWYNQTNLRAHQVHFLDFIKARTDTLTMVNDDHIGGTDFRGEPNCDVISFHKPNWSSGTDAVDSFNHYAPQFSGTPAKPFYFSEPVPEYQGDSGMNDGLMRLMWGTVVGGAGFVVQNDTSWSFDPYCGMVSEISDRDTVFDLEGYCCVFFNESSVNFGLMSPNGSLSSTGVCLANPGSDYVVYSQSGSSFTVNLSAAGGTLYCRFYNPRTGVFESTFQRTGGSSAESFTKPDSSDWVLHITSAQSSMSPIIKEVSSDPDTDAFAGTEYTKQLELQQGTSPITWSVVQGPGSIEVDSNGLVKGWTPVGCDVNDLITIEIQAQNPHGSDTETWQVEPRVYYMADNVVDFNDIAKMTDEWLLSDSNLVTDLDCSGDVNFLDYAILAEDWLYEETILEITNINKASYGIEYDNLYVGELQYIDRSYTFIGVPSFVEGETYIKTANDDKYSTGDSFLTFDVNLDVIVYVAHDDRIGSKPSWLTTDFTDTGEHITSIDASTTFSLYSKEFTAGTVAIGGNYGDVSSSMYTVVVAEQ